MSPQNKKIVIIAGVIFLILVFVVREPLDNAGNAILKTESWTKWDYLLKKYSKVYGVPWRWLKVIILNESSNGTNSRVKKGIADPTDEEGSKSSDGLSWGLMQVTKATAKGLTGRVVSAAELNNPDFSVKLSAQLLAELIRTFGLDFEKVMRAYNGGPNAAKTSSLATLPYYAKSKTNLAIIMQAHPGNELEI